MANNKKTRFQVDPDLLDYFDLKGENKKKPRSNNLKKNEDGSNQPFFNIDETTGGPNNTQEKCRCCGKSEYRYNMRICNNTISCKNFFCELCGKDELIWNHEISESWCYGCTVIYEKNVPTDYSTPYKNPL
jgi:hypothetical protein